MAANPDYLKELKTVEFSLNGKTIEAYEDETILQAASRNGVEIPHLCYTDNLRADGNCRACMVEIEGERVLQPSCVRTPTAGMVVNTENDPRGSFTAHGARTAAVRHGRKQIHAQ